MRSLITDISIGPGAHAHVAELLGGWRGRVLLLLLTPLLLASSVTSLAQVEESFHYPPLFYRGENIVTIIDPSGSGIERVSVLMSREITLLSPSGFVTGCPDSLQLRFDVGSVTTGEIAFITISTCDGRTAYDTIRAEEWTVRHEYTGLIPLGSDTCIPCFIESTAPRVLDSITVDNPALSVNILEPRRGDRYQVIGNVRFSYEVCYNPRIVELRTDTIRLFFQRDYPVGDLDAYEIVKPITVASFEKAIVDTTPAISMVPAIPPLVDPTPFRNIVMPSAVSPKKGEFFYGNYALVGHLAGYGVTDRISLLGGGAFVPPFLAKLYLGTIGAKVEALRLGDLRLAGGAQLAFSSTKESDITTVAPYVVGSYGNDRRRASIALGYGIKRHVTPLESFNRNALVFGVGGNIEVGRGWKVAAEIYTIETSGVLPLLMTARRFGENFAIDFGLGVDLSQEIGIFFTDGLTGEIDSLPIAPYISGIWVF